MPLPTQLLKDYRRFRTAAWAARDALHAARVWHDFLRVEWCPITDRGSVRWQCSPEVESYWDVYGEPEGYVNEYGRRVSPDESRKQVDDMIERNGCWYVAIEVRDPMTDEWELADSIGMIIEPDPCSPLHNPYAVQLMETALTNLAEKEVQNVLSLCRPVA